MFSILFGDTVVPSIELDCTLLLGYSILCKDIILLGSTTKKSTTQTESQFDLCGSFHPERGHATSGKTFEL